MTNDGIFENLVHKRAIITNEPRHKYAWKMYNIFESGDNYSGLEQ